MDLMERHARRKLFQLIERGELDALKQEVKWKRLDLSKYWTKRIPTRKDWMAGIHGRDENEFNLLHLAAATSGFSSHGVEVLKYLVEEHHLDPNMTSSKGDGESLPLHTATQYGSADAVRYFIDELHMDPMMLGSDKKTLLHYAAQGGKLETVKYFIEEKSIDPEVKDHWGRTPLYMCLYSIDSTGDYGGLDVIKYFVEAQKVDPMKLVQGDTMVHLAASSFSEVPNVLKYMIETLKCNPQAKNGNDETPAEYAVRVSGNDKHPVIEYLQHVVCGPE